MAKQILFHEEAQRKMLKGLDTVANAVGSTIGPKGRNAFIQRPYQDLITNDGVTIANSIELEDNFEDLGAKLIKNVTAKQNDEVGDGTTTVAVLTQAIVRECLKRPENPMEIRESLNEAGKEVVELLKKKSTPIKKEDLESVALISAENPEIAKMITELIGKLGDKAIINVEDSRTFQSGYEVMPGYDAPVGFLSPYFINDKSTGKAVFENVHVLVSEKKIASLVEIKHLADQFEHENISQCIIVADEIDESIIGLFVANNIKGVFKSVLIRARGEILEDIAGATGATLISDRHGVNFQNITLEHLGKAQKVSVDANKTLFLGNSAAGALRALELEGMAESEQNEYRKMKLKDRAAKLRGGVGVLKIYASTDFERDYLKLKAEDAIKAVQAAQEEGIVEGGGMTLWRISGEIKGKTIGEEILKKALKTPFQRIVDNAGKEYAEITGNLGKKGYDAKNDRLLDLMENGIIDPTKVERCAIQNAISAAGTFITSFVAIVDLPEKK